MRFSHVLPLAALSTAFVIPSEEVFSEVAIEKNHRGNSGLYEDVVSTKDDVLSSFKKHFEEVTETSKNAWNKASEVSKNAIDEAFDAAHAINTEIHDTAFDASSWLESEYDSFSSAFEDHPHHPPHHDKPHPPNETVWQLISKSKYTEKFSKMIAEYDDLVEALNSTKANVTIFAPADSAFDKIPEHAPKPSKEMLKAILSYHIVPEAYPASRVLVTHTVPTFLKADHLDSKERAQRLSFHIGLKGLTVNFYSRIAAINIFGTNGVIHGVDSILLPPPNVIKIIDLLPGEFSTLELGLGKTGLLEKLNSTDHYGGTFFAPSNFAFQKLGPKINAFLFSQYGQKYLKALLEYHLVPDNTLYSDAYYKAEKTETQDVPKGYFHVDLPTLLEDKSLSVDIARYGGLIDIKVNAFSRVVVQDGIAQDGVIQVVGDVLIPPKKLGGPGSMEVEYWNGEALDVEELKQRLAPFVAKSDL